MRQSSQSSIDIRTLDKMTVRALDKIAEVQTGYVLDSYVNRLDIQTCKIINDILSQINTSHSPRHEYSKLYCFTYFTTPYPAAVNSRPTIWKSLNYLRIWSRKMKIFRKFYFIWCIFRDLRSSLLSAYPAWMFS
jgi:hypothetical protein